MVGPYLSTLRVQHPATDLVVWGRCCPAPGGEADSWAQGRHRGRAGCSCTCSPEAPSLHSVPCAVQCGVEKPDQPLSVVCVCGRHPLCRARRGTSHPCPPPPRPPWGHPGRWQNAGGRGGGAAGCRGGAGSQGGAVGGGEGGGQGGQGPRGADPVVGLCHRTVWAPRGRGCQRCRGVEAKEDRWGVGSGGGVGQGVARRRGSCGHTCRHGHTSNCRPGTRQPSPPLPTPTTLSVRQRSPIEAPVLTPVCLHCACGSPFACARHH